MQRPLNIQYLFISKAAITSVLTLLFFFLNGSYCNAQGKEANIWYFGWGAGIDFNQGTPPTALTNSQMYIMTSDISGSASISDSTGNLLFYSDGVHIWNKEHQYMQNGQWIGHNSTQGAMIVPMQGNNHLYYFFNYALNSPGYDFQYSIIDMNLDNGLGGVVENQKGIYLLSNASFHLTAVKNATNDDIWVLTHGYMNDEYYAFRIASDSLQITPIISHVGSDFQDNTGYMKISPNGKKVAVGNDSGVDRFFEILDFDKNTGSVNDTNFIHIGGDCKSVDFSPDNTKFYATRNRLFQYDLEAGNPGEIIASEIQLSDEFVFHGALQTGPDGKVYCVFGTDYYLSVINDPNELGLAILTLMLFTFREGKQQVDCHPLSNPT